MSRTSLVYQSSLIYEALMVILYGSHYADRYKAILPFIPDGVSLADICCGPAIIYHRYLKSKNIRYVGIDVNPKLLAALGESGAEGQIMDITGPEPLPKADYLLMQASLYHFLPNQVDMILDKMLEAGQQKVIIAEPIKNLSDSNIPVLSWLAKRSANPGTGHQAHRFNESSLDAAMQRFKDNGQLETSFLVANGREKVYVIRTQ